MVWDTRCNKKGNLVVFFYFFYSYVHTMFGHFSPLFPTPLFLPHHPLATRQKTWLYFYFDRYGDHAILNYFERKISDFIRLPPGGT
jgi:hypothetical protein